MRNKYKIEFLVFCLFLLFGSVTAQTYNETINTIFEHVDKSKIAPLRPSLLNAPMRLVQV